MPAYNNIELGRTTTTLLMVPLHEAMADLIGDLDKATETLQTAIDRKELPAAYVEHDVVKQSTTPVFLCLCFVMLCHTAM